jgi:hypothetical protein
MSTSTLGIGKIVSWSAPKEPISVTTLRVALINAGFDPDYAKDMAPRNAFSRSIKELNKERIIRKVDEDENEVKFQFTREALVNTEFEYTKECELFLNKSSGTVRGSSNELAHHAQSLVFHNMSIRISSDITRLIQKIFENAGGDLAPIRPQGGVYFVPAAQDGLVVSVKQLLRDVGGELIVYSLEDDDDTKQSVESQLTAYLMARIEDFNQSIDALTAESRDSVIGRRVADCEKIRGKLESLKYLLGGAADSIATAISESETKMINAVSASISDEAIAAKNGNAAAA